MRNRKMYLIRLSGLFLISALLLQLHQSANAQDESLADRVQTLERSFSVLGSQLSLILTELNTIRSQRGEVGPPGRNGTDGVDGRNGTDGRDGVDGQNGTDGTWSGGPACRISRPFEEAEHADMPDPGDMHLLFGCPNDYPRDMGTISRGVILCCKVE